mgnify:FL=1
MKKSHLAFTITGVAVLMLGLAFASKPIYDTFCRVTGFGGTTQVATQRPDRILDRVITVRLDANAPNTPFDFKPVDRKTDIKIGDTTIVTFELTNTSNRPVLGLAGYNVTPFKTAEYFTKLECFCFTERLFEPGETAVLPVMFFIDPRLDDDPLLDDVKTITLSYTFYEVQGGNESLASFSNLVSEDE